LTPHPGRLAATFDVPVESRSRGTARFAELERQIQETAFPYPEAEHV
jgi:NitT/TauT family transport system ATP-binding protein